MVNVFAVPVFFIVFRETLETSIIVSVLLAFLKQTLGPERDPAVYKKLVRQVWLGTGLGLVVCLIIGAGLIGAFYGLGTDKWAGTEDIWEGVFGLVASIVISLMGAALLRVSKLQDKWRVKLARALEAKHVKADTRTGRFKRWAEKYAMFILPFITVLREGLEAIVFIGGVSVGQPATAFPIAVICGLLAGCLIGFFIYKGGNYASIQIFLIVSTCFLYLVAAGLFSKAVGDFEADKWNRVIGGDAAETGNGAGSYDIRNSVWHVNCCSADLSGGGGWGIFNSLFGWVNSATYGSVISYNLYWLVVIVGFVAMRYNETKGHWPLLKAKAGKNDAASSSGSDSGVDGETVEHKGTLSKPVEEGTVPSSNVRTVEV
ncbi:MAG: orotidine 5'-phosphate decarboxylase [Chaenotheca gracillima]|nr:MAG: orotidine 5'-phosphate decarboxylase [Chaenotheca gracillima]